MGKWRKNSIITVTAISIPAAVFRLDFLKKCRSFGQGAVSQDGHDAARKLARPSFCKSPPRALRRSLRRAGELLRSHFGKPLEVNYLSGAVVRIGEKHGVQAPTHKFITQALAIDVAGKTSS